MSSNEIRVGIIGNPNVGKTYLFNRLTACESCVGNWSGVTQTACKAKSKQGNHYEVIDFPGCHAIREYKPDITLQDPVHDLEQQIDNNQINVWLNVIDIEHLEKQLYLTVQLLEAKQRVIVVLNRIDRLPAISKNIDIQQLGKFLNTPIVKVSAKLGLGIRALQSTIEDHLNTEQQSHDHYPVQYHASIERLLTKTEIQLGHQATRFSAWSALIASDYSEKPPAWHFEPAIAERIHPQHLMTDEMTLTRFERIKRWMQHVVTKKAATRQHADKHWDRWFLHKWLGLPLFFSMMLLVFWLSMGVGQLLQGVVEPLLRMMVIDVPNLICHDYAVPQVIALLITQGVGLSIMTALSFFPILYVMFLALHALEESGYMTRAAVVMDRLMRWCHLPGESLVALVLGLGCNVPGILATRHIPNHNDKVVTALMMPFMSCGARLTIFAVFSSVFFPQHAAGVLFILYLLGISIAVLTGILARSTGLVQATNAETYLLELPAYQWPSLAIGLRQAYQRSQRFVMNAFTIILPVCCILALCNHIDIQGNFLQIPGDQSIIASIGKSLGVLFAPIGLTADHWPLIVSLLMGLLAKEVVISTLSIFYIQMSDPLQQTVGTLSTLWQSSLAEALENAQTWYAYFIPFVQAETPNWAFYFNQQHISPQAVMGYLIFTLLYFPCISTLYATARQVGWRWAGFSVLWSTLVAYLCAFTYQMVVHVPLPLYDAIWLISLGGLCYATATGLKWFIKTRKARSATPQVAP